MNSEINKEKLNKKSEVFIKKSSRTIQIISYSTISQ